ncbi:MAG: UDP-N-acetylglucosamine 1-carboxyvinyltransferase [Candidatus Paraimprobicoccus trichonymphae]|uniref:UDP-N-acetylglucosamine 1-carboxyvinyltransferase n=1 Tax=Candidatus Paraimprobicoccus trichonymphae TaxID=3033793 RepID=A0AA48IHF3_9FIRM|nr:MAG: UDP-N-acetylglucosamine 1-carboxyvinyltransferase [Candidatus Paraimprobicoccus trichonymphae]
MEKIVINGGKKLNGKVSISGAKNAAVAIIPATILSNGICTIGNIPNISDITLICNIMAELGAVVKVLNKNTLEIDTRNVLSHIASSDLIRKMRGSYYLLGALLGKFSKATVLMPGGCALGVRPIDQHLKGFLALGAKYELKSGVVSITCDKLIGNNIYLDIVSVGATINIMLAAAKAHGTTVIENTAKEPHVVDLANFLNCMGADICGAGTDVIKIRGVRELKSTDYSIIPDQIEAGTYMTAAAVTNGNIIIKNVIPKHLDSTIAKLEEIGVSVKVYDESIQVSNEKTCLNKCNIKTLPYPGFPTDMQPQITTLLAIANGTSIINESIWNNRFRYVEELRRMGAQISVDSKMAIVEGVKSLNGATVQATDLRAGAALIIAGLSAFGTTIIEEISYIERGYENIVEKFRELGADIKKIPYEYEVSENVV